LVYTFCISFRLAITGEHRDFKFGVQVDYSEVPAYGWQTIPERGVVTSLEPFLQEKLWTYHGRPIVLSLTAFNNAANGGRVFIAPMMVDASHTIR